MNTNKLACVEFNQSRLDNVTFQYRSVSVLIIINAQKILIMCDHFYFKVRFGPTSQIEYVSELHFQGLCVSANHWTICRVSFIRLRFLFKRSLGFKLITTELYNTNRKAKASIDKDCNRNKDCYIIELHYALKWFKSIQ